MNKFLFLSVLACLFCVSCSAGPVRQAAVPMPKVSLAESPVAEIYEEPSDLACAYSYFLAGRAAETDGNNDIALESYEKALVCDNKADYIMSRLAVLLIRMGKRQQALTMLDKIITQNPQDINTRIVLANLYAAMGMNDKAVEVYLDILKIDPGNVNAMLMLGAFYARNREYEQAKKLLEELVQNSPDSYMGYYYLAKLYRELKFIDKSLIYYDKAINLNWSAVFAFETAELLEQQKRYDEAIVLYRRILQEDDANERAANALIGIFMKTNQPDRALEELKEIRAFATDVLRIDFTMGRVYMEQKRYDEAIKKFKSVLDENPEFMPARALLALTYHELSDDEAAKNLLRQVKPADQGYEEAVLLMVRIMQEAKDLIGVERELSERILNKETRQASFYSALASLYKKDNKIEQARQVFLQAIKDLPDDTRLLFDYGVFLDSIGETDAALAVMEGILVIDSEDVYALNYVGYTWGEKGMNLEKALQYIQKAITAKPEDGFIRDSLGWVYYKSGDLERAMQELIKALEIEPDDPVINEHMGDVYLKAGSDQKAVELYKKAMQLYKEENKQEAVRKKLQDLEKR